MYLSTMSILDQEKITDYHVFFLNLYCKSAAYVCIKNDEDLKFLTYSSRGVFMEELTNQLISQSLIFSHIYIYSELFVLTTTGVTSK